MDPQVPTTGPAYDPSKPTYYYEAYVYQDPSWNLISSGWLADPSSVPGMRQLYAAQYNLPVETRIWSQDTKSWGAWAASSSAPPTPTAAPVTPPSTSPAADLVVPAVLAGVGAAAAYAFTGNTDWGLRRPAAPINVGAGLGLLAGLVAVTARWK